MRDKDFEYIIIPVFNEEVVIGDMVRDTKSNGHKNVIVVDDGSVDRSFERASKAGAVVIRHEINRGKGAAVKTGIEAARSFGAKCIAVLDGDGQHDPGEIRIMLDKIHSGYDVALGNRLANFNDFPRHKLLVNLIGNFVTWMFCGLWVQDSQSGFRAFSEKALEEIETSADRYEYESEIIREIFKKKLRHVEVPIKVRYTRHSTTKNQRQNIKNGLRTFYKILIKS